MASWSCCRRRRNGNMSLPAGNFFVLSTVSYQAAHRATQAAVLAMTEEVLESVSEIQPGGCAMLGLESEVISLNSLGSLFGGSLLSPSQLPLQTAPARDEDDDDDQDDDFDDDDFDDEDYE